MAKKRKACNPTPVKRPDTKTDEDRVHEAAAFINDRVQAAVAKYGEGAAMVALSTCLGAALCTLVQMGEMTAAERDFCVANCASIANEDPEKNPESFVLVEKPVRGKVKGISIQTAIDHLRKVGAGRVKEQAEKFFGMPGPPAEAQELVAKFEALSEEKGKHYALLAFSTVYGWALSDSMESGELTDEELTSLLSHSADLATCPETVGGDS